MVTGVGARGSSPRWQIEDPQTGVEDPSPQQHSSRNICWEVHNLKRCRAYKNFFFFESMAVSFIWVFLFLFLRRSWRFTRRWAPLADQNNSRLIDVTPASLSRTPVAHYLGTNASTKEHGICESIPTLSIVRLTQHIFTISAFFLLFIVVLDLFKNLWVSKRIIFSNPRVCYKD